MSVIVLGECGCTHEGSKEALLKLLETAHACGCDVFKPQWCSDPQAMLERRHIGPDHPKRAYYERAYSWLQWPVEWHEEFRTRCHALGMQYAVSVYLPQDVATVAPFVDYLKIASFEAASGMAASTGVALIVSTGMMSEEDLVHREYGDAALLHCVSAYPAPLAAMNLRVLRAANRGGYYVGSEVDGLSDHSRNLVAGAVAVGAGAEIIETHYRLDTCHPTNPDYAVAFTPAEFRQYIQNVRDAEAMMGDGIKRVQPCEEAMLPYRVTP